MKVGRREKGRELLTMLPLFYLGVHSVLVALLSEKADIQYNPEVTNPEVLLQEVKELGFKADLVSDQEGYQPGKLDLTVS